MSTSRKPFVKLLEDALPADLENYKKTSSSFLTQKNGASRVFNDFNVLDRQTVEEICGDIKKILGNFKSAPNAAIDKNDETNTKNHLKKLAKIACDDLLDEKGNINKSIIEYLEWKNNNYALMRHQDSLICSFLNAAYAQIESASPNFNAEKYANFTPFINIYLSACVVEVLKERGLHHIAKKVEENSAIMQIIHYASENPVTTFGVITGIATAIAAVGVFAFNLWQKSNTPAEAKEAAHNVPKPPF